MSEESTYPVQTKDGTIRVRGRRNAATHPERARKPTNPWNLFLYALRVEGFTFAQSLRVERRLLKFQLNVREGTDVAQKDDKETPPIRLAGPRGKITPGEKDVADKVKVNRGAIYTTTFNGWGGAYSKPAELNSPDLMDRMQRDHPDDTYAVPEFFTIAALLGQVRYDGIIPLAGLLREVNEQLQTRGSDRADFDFRSFYASYNYTYQVIESVGSNDRVVLEVRDDEIRFRGGA